MTSINDGDAVTAASVNNQINTIVNDYNGGISAPNLASGAVTTTKITNSTVTADKLATGAAAATVATSQTTASTSYVDLATVGPSVTVTIGVNGLALVIFTSLLQNNNTSSQSAASFVASGTNTIAIGTYELSNIFTANFSIVPSRVVLLTGLAPGSTTFKLQYKVNGGTGTFSSREVSVVPL